MVRIPARSCKGIPSLWKTEVSNLFQNFYQFSTLVEIPANLRLLRNSIERMSFLRDSCDKQDISLFRSSPFFASSRLLTILLCSSTYSGPTGGHVSELQKTLLQTTWNLYAKELVDWKYHLSLKPFSSSGSNNWISWGLLSEERVSHFTSTFLAEHAGVSKRSYQKKLGEERMCADVFPCLNKQQKVFFTIGESHSTWQWNNSRNFYYS